MTTYKPLDIVPIVGLMGKARSGKDTIAAILKKHYKIQRIAFADALKNKAMDDFGLTYDQVYGDNKEVKIEKYNMSVREILQKVGTDWYRTVYENYWVDKVYKQLTNYTINTANGICITDVRFENEINFVKDIGGLIVKVTKPDLIEINANKHISETILDNYKDYDMEIINDGTLEELEMKVVAMAKFL